MESKNDANPRLTSRARSSGEKKETLLKLGTFFKEKVLKEDT